MDTIFPEGAALHRTELFARKLHKRRILKDADAVIPVIGGEGVGKSTFILQWLLLWMAIRNGYDSLQVPDHETLFAKIKSTRSDLKQSMTAAPERSTVAMPDAGRALFRKEAMVEDQREIEKDFFDVRFRNLVFLLGFQDWKQVPGFVASRRAQFCFYIPRRGELWGYSRSTIDERIGEGRGTGAWPEPDLQDKFPALDNTDLWDAYKKFDAEEKVDRMSADEEQDPEDARKAAQTAVVLRATQQEGMTQREAARLIEFTKSWVSDRVQEWKAGEHTDLVDINNDRTARQKRA
jgi:predicted XRE-type DNA-binding protein